MFRVPPTPPHPQWRKEFDVAGLLSTEELPPELEPLGMLHGRSRAGEPVTYNYYGGADMDRVFGDAGAVSRCARRLGSWADGRVL